MELNETQLKQLLMIIKTKGMCNCDRCDLKDTSGYCCTMWKDLGEGRPILQTILSAKQMVRDLIEGKEK